MHARNNRFAAWIAAGVVLLAPAANARQDAAEEASDDAATALRDRVRSEAARLRAELDAAQAAEATDGLLARRATVLASLTPAFLLAEAASAAAARDSAPRTDPGPELLAAWRVEHREGAPTARWSDPAGPARVRTALRAWAATGSRAVACTATTHAVRFTGEDAPPTIAWSVSAWGSPCTTHARAWWHEPAAEHMALDFPLSPDGLDLRWEPDGVRLAQDGGAAHRERWGPGPADFINPPDLYALEDGLRCFRAADAVPDASGDTARPDDDRAAQVITRELLRPDGRRLRLERWQFDGRSLRSLVIDQDAALLVHGAPVGYDIVSEVDGEVVDRTQHRPTSTVTAFPDGLRIAVSFRRPDASRDVVPADVLVDAHAAFPDRVVFTDRDGPLAVVQIAGLAILEGGAAPDDATDAPHAAERLLPGLGCMAASAQVRAQASAALLQAIEADDPAAAGAAAATIAAIQAADGVSAGVGAIAFERACLRALRGGHARAAEAIARGAWLEAWHGCDHHEQGEAIVRVRAAHAADALAWLGEAVPTSADAVASGAAVRDPSTLPPRSRELLDGVRAALGASRCVAPGTVARAAGAVCDALAAAGREVTHDDRHVASLVAGTRAWLDAGRAGLDTSDGKPVREDAARSFATALLRAATVEQAPVGATETHRNGLMRFADAAREAITAIGGCAGWSRSEIDEESAVARDRVRAVAGLVGNPFMPAWMPSDARAADTPPSVRTIRDSLASDPVLVSMASRQAARAGVVALVASPELADARRRAGRRAVARDVADAALRAFDAWIRRPRAAEVGDPQNGQGSDGSPKRPPSDPSAHLPCEGHPAGPFPQPEGRASRVPAEAAQPDRRWDCLIHLVGMQVPDPGSSRSPAAKARGFAGCAACAHAPAACEGRTGPFSGAAGLIRPPPRASAGSRGRSAPIPPPGCRRWPARWRRADARTCRG